ncbi:MAG TPA: thiopurine S-methyltransferase [Steroidobacteraceae bacterium]|jgi:thiopurine S-methyltransferase|nr:thiopurine S-methyltransferase [Steroidobacteraceae bacterium]
MQPQFWHDRWRVGQIGFHQPKVEPELERHWPLLGLAPQSRIFVPLCGKTLDMVWLRARGHHVLGAEISALAIEAFCAENGVLARRRARGIGIDVFEAEGYLLYRGDLFALAPEDTLGVAGVYDRASLMSWPPEIRARYANAMTALTAAGAVTLLVVLEYDPAQMSGPPFSVSAADLDGLYARHHSIDELSRRDILEDEPRLRAKGLTRLQQVCYRLMRR